MPEWDELDLTPGAREILEWNGGPGEMPLVCRRSVPAEIAVKLRSAVAERLFPQAHSPAGALAGLWLAWSGYEEAHGIAQELHTAEGSYWHGIVHRQEPDDWNSGYWFRRVGRHPIFPALAQGAADLAGSYPRAAALPARDWDPEQLIRYCAQARNAPGGETERYAVAVQQLEWKLLFAWCARVRR
ncbi:MAG: hypothetical protein HY821_01295 [Acidobacteria bacterium]|nr:hypothetical protein [Acidobacteriota bacterium]